MQKGKAFAVKVRLSGSRPGHRPQRGRPGSRPSDITPAKHSLPIKATQFHAKPFLGLADVASLFCIPMWPTPSRGVPKEVSEFDAQREPARSVGARGARMAGLTSCVPLSGRKEKVRHRPQECGLDMKKVAASLFFPPPPLLTLPHPLLPLPFWRRLAAL